MTPTNGTTIYLTVTIESDPMSVYNTDGFYVLTRAPIETTKLFFQPSAGTPSSSIYIARNSSTSALDPSAPLTSYLTSYSKIHKNI